MFQNVGMVCECAADIDKNSFPWKEICAMPGQGWQRPCQFSVLHPVHRIQTLQLLGIFEDCLNLPHWDCISFRRMSSLGSFPRKLPSCRLCLGGQSLCSEPPSPKILLLSTNVLWFFTLSPDSQCNISFPCLFLFLPSPSSPTPASPL